MKILAIALGLLSLVATKQVFTTNVDDASPALKKCLEQKCPDQYNKCKATSGCEDKLNKCVDKCGEKIAQTCYTFCIGTPGAAANAATCAVNQKCIVNIQTKQEKLLGLAIEAIEVLMENPN